jgi:hypothetical protein
MEENERKKLRAQVALRILAGELMLAAAMVVGGGLAFAGSKLLVMAFDLHTLPWGFAAFVGGVLCMFAILYLGYLIIRVAPVVYRLFCWYRAEIEKEGP